MMRNRVAALLAVLAVAGTANLAAQQYNQRLVATEPDRMGLILCPLKFSGKINDAQKELKNGIEDKDAAKRAAALLKGEQIAKAAIASGEGATAAGWYVLARLALARGDLRGADSAFTRAEQLMPDCEVDINQYRQGAWAVLANAGIEKSQMGDADSALILLRHATVIYRGLPHVFENMGIMFANTGAIDSAVVYFERAVAASENDTSLVENRNSSTLNLALMLQRSGRHGEAIQTLNRYLTWNPGDADARRSLVFSFREAGMADSADAVEQALVAEFAAMNLDSLSSNDLMAVGVSHFNAKEYRRAAEIFEKLKARNPWSRDAVYNLANAYLALDDKPNLTSSSRELLAIEPMNEDAYRLLGQGYRDRFQDSLLVVAEQMVGLPIHIEVTGFAPSSSGARLMATAIGREAMDVSGTRLTPVPVNLVVEFVTEDGTVLGSQAVTIPALEAKATHEFMAEARAEGIAGWRYRRP